MPSPRIYAVVVSAFTVFLLAIGTGGTPAASAPADLYANLMGRWVGEGRLGFRGGQTEKVTCRVTYREGEAAGELKQAVRCAAPSGQIDVAADVIDTDGTLAGTWTERSRNWTGDITGKVNPNGFKVAVRGDLVSADMDIIVKDVRQIIEIKFNEGTLIGLTLLLTKG